MKSIIVTTIGALTNIQKVNARMSGGNMTGGGMMGMMAGPGPNITDSLKFSTVKGNAFPHR
jgi:hypothetical protein